MLPAAVGMSLMTLALTCIPAHAFTSRADSTFHADTTLTAALLPIPVRAAPLPTAADFARARAMAMRNAPDSAVNVIRHALREHRSDLEVQIAGVELLEQCDRESLAVAYCREMWQADTTSALAAELYAQVLPDSLARPLVDRALALDPSLARGWLDRAASQRSSDLNAGLRADLRALQLDPSLAYGWEIAGALFVGRHDSTAAIAAFRGAIAADTTSRLVIVYYVTKSISRSPSWGLIALCSISEGTFLPADAARAHLLIRHGQPGSARALANRLANATEAPDYALRLYHRAAVYAQLGDR